MINNLELLCILYEKSVHHLYLKYAHQYCPEPDILALFGATSVKQPDIIFQIQVDTITGDREIIPIVNKEKLIQNTIPSEIREEKTDILLSVEPKEKNPVVSYIPEQSIPTVSALKNKKEKNVLNHLRILSQTSGTPVSGRAIVHINEVLLDGTGLTNLPEEVELLYYPTLKTGWAVVEGTLQENKMQVSNIQFCEKEWCTDVP